MAARQSVSMTPKMRMFDDSGTSLEDMDDKMKMSKASMSMTMTFNGKLPLSLLFNEIQLESKADLVIACIVLVFLGVLYETVKYIRIKLMDPKSNISCCGCLQNVNCGPKIDRYDIELQSNKTMRVFIGESSNSSSEDSFKHSQKPRKSKKLIKHFIETGFHALQLFLSYLIMLAVMTYNVYVVMSIIVGSVAGYFIIHLPRKPRPSSRFRQDLLRQVDCH